MNIRTLINEFIVKINRPIKNYKKVIQNYESINTLN